MKMKARILIMFLLIGATTGLISCGDDDCPSKTFDTLEACEDATDGTLCFCTKDGDNWKAVKNI
jgi:hypothetical protein